MLNEAWTWHPLGELAQQMQYGLSLRGAEAGRYPILRMNCQQDGRVLLRDLQYVDVDDKTAHAFRIRRGDILFNRTNSYELVGRAALVETETEAVFASYLVRVSVDQSRLDPRFLNFFLNWDWAQAELKKLASRAVGQANISAGKLRSFSIPVPPADEQRAIAAALGQVREAITVHERIVVAAQELKRAAMQAIFTHGLRSEMQRETEIGLVPESWAVARLADHFSVVSGGTPSRGNPSYWTGGTIPWVKTAEVDYRIIGETEESITQAGLDGSAAKLLQPGTLLLAMYGQGVTRGKVAVLAIEAACNQACAAIAPTDGEVDTRYLYHFLTAQYAAIRQLAHGGQQQNLNLDIVRGLPVAFPITQSDQKEVVAVLDGIDRKIDLHRRKRAVLADLFRSLLHQLMTGELLVADLDLTELAPEPFAGVAA